MSDKYGGLTEKEAALAKDEEVEPGDGASWHFEILKEDWFPEKVDPTIQIYKVCETKEDIRALPGPTMAEVKEAFVERDRLGALREENGMLRKDRDRWEKSSVHWNSRFVEEYGRRRELLAQLDKLLHENGELSKENALLRKENGTLRMRQSWR